MKVDVCGINKNYVTAKGTMLFTYTLSDPLYQYSSIHLTYYTLPLYKGTTHTLVQSTATILVIKHTFNNLTNHSITLVLPLFKYFTVHPFNPATFPAFISFTAPCTSSFMICSTKHFHSIFPSKCNSHSLNIFLYI